MIRAKIDISDVERGLRAMIQQGARSRGALADLRKPLRQDQMEHARAMEGPRGKWAPRSRASVLRARRSKSRSRVKGANRRLLASLPRRTLLIKNEGRAIVAKSKVRWAGIHQYGGTAGHGAKIPARPFLWFSEKFLKIAMEKILDRSFKEWVRG